jgi:hypothetical protein
VISLDYDGYLRALLQNAEISLARTGEINDLARQIKNDYSVFPDGDLIHGKDALCLLEIAVAELGVRQDEGARLLWTSFEAAFIEQGSTLDAVVRFLCQTT